MKKHLAYLTCTAVVCLFIITTALKAMSSTFYNDSFPENLAIKVELMPLIFPLHMFTGALALILLPIAYWLRRKSRWHKIIGRIAAIDVVIAGVTAFPVALVAPITFWSALGFSAQALLWLIFLALGIYFIRNRQMAAHRACMLMMMATTAGALVFRISHALWSNYGSTLYFEEFYIINSWAAWLLPLIGCAIFLQKTSKAKSMTLGRVLQP